MSQMFTLSSPSSSASSSSDSDEFTPAQILSLAIKKRRALANEKRRDFRRELLHTGVIQSLCKHLGEGRRRRRRASRKRRALSIASPVVNEPHVQSPPEAKAPRLCPSSPALDDDEDPFGIAPLIAEMCASAKKRPNACRVAASSDQWYDGNDLSQPANPIA